MSGRQDDVDEHEGQPFMAMEYLEGMTLKERIAIGGRHGVPLPVDTLLDLGIQIADGLDAAHSKGIIRRDIKESLDCLDKYLGPVK